MGEREGVGKGCMEGERGRRNAEQRGEERHKNATHGQNHTLLNTAIN